MLINVKRYIYRMIPNFLVHLLFDNRDWQEKRAGSLSSRPHIFHTCNVYSRLTRPNPFPTWAKDPAWAKNREKTNMPPDQLWPPTLTIPDTNSLTKSQDLKINELIFAWSHHRNVFAETEISVNIRINSHRSPQNKNLKTVTMQGMVKKTQERKEDPPPFPRN